MRRFQRLSLLTKVFLANGAVLLVIALLLLFSPVEIDFPVTPSQAITIVAGFLVSLAVNAALLRPVTAPLRRLARDMREVEAGAPPRRIHIAGADAEVAALTEAFNDMLDRLAEERRDSGRKMVAAQEEVRRRIARELHDEVGQVLTGVMLTLDDPEARESVRHSLQEVRRIAGELRPQTLDELGLSSSLRALCTTTLHGRSGVRCRLRLEPGEANVDPEVELVVYRVAQESITNVLRHADATEVSVVLERHDGALRLVVRDNGRGLPDDLDGDGSGLAGMREGAARGRQPQRRAGKRDRNRGRAEHPGSGAAMTVPLKTRILLADDHPMVRRGLRMVLDAEPDLEVVAEAGDGAEAVEAALAEDVDLVVLDVAMPRLTGLQAAAELRKRRPELKTLMLSMYDSEQYFFQALKAGASGYVLKSAADHDLVVACRSAMRGEPFLYPAAVTALIRDYLDRAERDPDAGGEVLTPRELEIVKLVAEGYSTEEIAETLVISKKTVEHHRAHVLEKLGMRDRVELTRYAIRRGLVEP